MTRVRSARSRKAAGSGLSRKWRVAVLVSGDGGNLQALLDSGVEVSLVAADRRAKALERARTAKVPTAMLDRAAYSGRQQHEEALKSTIDAYGADLIVLAGFMRVLSAGFVRYYSGKMVNIHPSLLPEFPGLDTHSRALKAGVHKHGCTVHWVTDEVDKGPVIRQSEVPVLAGDDPDLLAARVASAEHDLYPAVVGDILAGRERSPL